MSLLPGLLLLCSFIELSGNKTYSAKDEHPRIINIVNFIRLLNPRDAAITEDVL